MTHIATTLADSNYIASEQDHYIGVDSRKPVTITLPPTPSEGKVIIVKAEMKPPLGNRKITVTTNDGSLIDGYTKIDIQVSHEFLTLVYRALHWNIIS